MTKLFCDRCGKEVHNRGDRTSVTVETSHGKDHIYDLCDDCYKELAKFLEPINLLSAANKLRW